MAKRVKTIIRLQLPAGKATAAPPVGPSLAPHGVNPAAFIKEYNERTASMVGTVIPAEITVYEDRSFTFITKTPPAADLLKKAAGVDKGSKVPNRDKVARITAQQLREIAQTKMPDLNALDIEAAEHMIAGTARSMGIEVTP